MVLPGRRRWFSLETGEWLTPGKVAAAADPATTPLFVRDGSIVPAFSEPGSKNLGKVEFHIFVDRTDAELLYRFDDGETFGYRRGERSVAEVRAKRRGEELAIEVRLVEEGFGSLEYAIVIHGEPTEVRLNGSRVSLTKTLVDWAGQPVRAFLVKGATPFIASPRGNAP